MLPVAGIRALFPAIEASPDALLDNAGGSQVPRCVADAIRDYMLTTYVQLGADYDTSRRSTETVERAHQFIRLFMNGAGRGQVVLASSTTVLCALLAECYARATDDGRDEIVVAQTAHEANAGPWFRMAERGFTVHTWPIEPERFELKLDNLRALLSDRTRIVAFPHVSNVLGRIEDAGAITKLAHEAGARVVIDGVAYAPHRAIDVAALEADWYVYSTYKVFGPHMAALFGTESAMAELEGPNHFFIPRTETPYKFEPGGPSHEGCAGLLALWPYLAALAGAVPGDEPSRAAVERAFGRIIELETALQTRLLEYLVTKPEVRIIGPERSTADRVATVSFVHRHRPSAEIVNAANARGYGIRFGHFYAYRLCNRLTREGILHDVEDGVIRVSMLHYNTPAEIDRLIECLDEVL
ncbi:MAG: aminotransferase class V-fold PLP-dependent enzyme [bacterium]|nr:aminotransferase class V-fold PLP-dependent enzyme [bacterium]